MPNYSLIELSKLADVTPRTIRYYIAQGLLPSPGQLWSGSVYIGADTFIGPAFIGVGAAPAGRWTLYMLLGAP